MAFLKEKNKIGIIGVGMVGGALKQYFESKRVKIFVYDKYKEIGSIKEINQADIIFICVPTPFNEKNGYDLTIVEDAIKIIKGRKIVVIKSTVPPGSTLGFQNKYPRHKFLLNPEFLRELTAYQDMVSPSKQIIGYTPKTKKIAKNILELLPNAQAEFIVPAIEAELVKYFINCFLSLKVVFANQIYDLCQALKIDYEKVKEMAVADPRVGNSHLDIFYSGARGYFGKCLPKDMRTLIQKAKEAGVDLELLKTAERINNRFLRKQKIYKIMEDVERVKKTFKRK
jgi:UDPglucose 6-dehydrogenase